MTRPVCYSIVDLPDGSFGVVAVVGSGKVFRRVGLLTLAEAEECVEVLRAAMAACRAPVIDAPADLMGAAAQRRDDQAGRGG
ncbi:hypothetical protein [Methylobacterium nigriterrae]|uniref:hypothetical protein n=1 Tax=Methylobacterium nigriterrae TaxID=3127512 RepID=UPI003013A1D0